MPYDFDDKLAEGEAHERVLDRYFARDFAIVPVNHFGQRQGRDRLYTPLAGGDAFHVEYKADSKAARTRNFWVETESVVGAKEGWAIAADSAILVYYLPLLHTAYWIRLRRFQAQVPAWVAAHPRRETESDGRFGRYETAGVIVPLRELAAIADATHTIPPGGDVTANGRGGIQVRAGNHWECPQWAIYGGKELPWFVVLERLATARRLWPGLRWRLSNAAAD